MEQAKMDFLNQLRLSFIEMKNAIEEKNKDTILHRADNFLYGINMNYSVLEENSELNEIFKILNGTVFDLSISEQYYTATQKFLEYFPQFDSTLTEAIRKYSNNN